MRCAQAERLLDAYVDGTLPGTQATDVGKHVAGCARCTERVRLAYAVSEALGAAPDIRAPAGFAGRVMEGVYRNALEGDPRPDARRAAAAYRRLGVSFLLTAGVLALSLLVPRVAYPALLGGAEAGMTRGGGAVVRGILTGADDLVRGALGETTGGGETR